MATALGEELRSLRKLKGHSLRAVAEQADISAAYLQKLETGDVKNPSPNVLFSLSEVLGASYTHLMVLAGYVVPGAEDMDSAEAFNTALASADLTEAERHAVSAYISLLREQRTK